ncbi:MAG: hypothetical protein RRA15_08495 [bacterium]|nr:hypothetical protein [bacterium]MDT8366519.1 hypothetical protein [bacterium]
MKKFAFIVFSLLALAVLASPSYAVMLMKPQIAPKPTPRIPGSITSPSADGDKKCDPATADWVDVPGSCFDRGTEIICRIQNTCSGEQRAVVIQKGNLPGKPYGGIAR